MLARHSGHVRSRLNHVDTQSSQNTCCTQTIQTRTVLKLMVNSGIRYGAAYAISKVAADWHELMTLQRTMRPSIARAREQLDPRSADSKHTTAPILWVMGWRPSVVTLGLHPITHKLIVISRPAEGRRLSWPVHCRLATCSRLPANDLWWYSKWNLKVASRHQPRAPTQARRCEQLAQGWTYKNLR